MAMGKAAVAYFERGGDLSEITQAAVRARDTAVARLKSDRKALRATAGELAAVSQPVEHAPDRDPSVADA